MCLILIALQQHKDYPLIVIANRDEFYARPTRTAHWWDDDADIFAGRD
ncbi:MAG: NRDE family protein, partial [Gammaproteobacteria bacterium]|nr:NRDE family protein [Gammaproteobacteria bacterium]